MGFLQQGPLQAQTPAPGAGHSGIGKCAQAPPQLPRGILHSWQVEPQMTDAGGTAASFSVTGRSKQSWQQPVLRLKHSGGCVGIDGHSGTLRPQEGGPANTGRMAPAMGQTEVCWRAKARREGNCSNPGGPHGKGDGCGGSEGPGVGGRLRQARATWKQRCRAGARLGDLGLPDLLSSLSWGPCSSCPGTRMA